jgi:hypothetical protein
MIGGQMDNFGVRTIKSPLRYFLLEVKQSSPTVLTEEKVRQAISAQFLRLFGEKALASAELDVFLQGPTQAICSIQNNLAVCLRCSLALPPVPLHDCEEIEAFHVLFEASFLQSLLHNSRFDFPPLL